MEPVAARLAERGLDLGTMTDVGPSKHRPPADPAHRAVTRLEQLRNPPLGPTAPSITPVVSL